MNIVSVFGTWPACIWRPVFSRIAAMPAFVFFVAVPVWAGEPDPQFDGHRRIDLWQGVKMPNSRGLHITDSVSNHRTWRIASPRLYAFQPCADERTNTAVILIPGGGYAKQAYEAAGITMARWLNSIGITAFVLLHRLPNSPDLTNGWEAPVQDAQRAVRYVRANAAEYGVAPDRIGVMGCSAGGHVCACVSTIADDMSLAGDSLDRHSFRPDFAILVSPVIRMADGLERHFLCSEAGNEELLARYSMDRHVTPANPPTLFIHASDDRTVKPVHSLSMYQALIDKGVTRSSIHIFPFGRHSIAVRRQPGTTALWPEIAERWMEETGFLEPLKYGR